MRPAAGSGPHCQGEARSICSRKRRKLLQCKREQSLIHEACATLARMKEAHEVEEIRPGASGHRSIFRNRPRSHVLQSQQYGRLCFCYRLEEQSRTDQRLPGRLRVRRTDADPGFALILRGAEIRSPAVTSPNGNNLFVLNHDDSTIVQFAIGTDGKLYPQQTCNTPGSEPVALAINAAGTFLYVVDFYSQETPGGPVYSSSNPGPGDLVVYPVDPTSGSLGGGNCTPVTQTFVDCQ